MVASYRSVSEGRSGTCMLVNTAFSRSPRLATASCAEASVSTPLTRARYRHWHSSPSHWTLGHSLPSTGA